MCERINTFGNCLWCLCSLLLSEQVPHNSDLRDYWIGTKTCMRISAVCKCVSLSCFANNLGPISILPFASDMRKPSLFLPLSHHNIYMLIFRHPHLHVCKRIVVVFRRPISTHITLHTLYTFPHVVRLYSLPYATKLMLMHSNISQAKPNERRTSLFRVNRSRLVDVRRAVQIQIDISRVISVCDYFFLNIIIIAHCRSVNLQRIEL